LHSHRHVAPPANVRNELGERRSDPTKRHAWDRVSLRSSTTASSRESKTRIGLSGRRRSEEANGHVRLPPGGDSYRHSECSAWASTRWEGAISGEDWGSAGEAALSAISAIDTIDEYPLLDAGQLIAILHSWYQE
jgi:hypothetical protein